MADAESEWARTHPVPESSVSDNLLMLWNYPVAKSDLSTAHQQAIQRFLAIEWLGPSSSRVELTVRGHASDTGNPQINSGLSDARAQQVAQYLRQQGFKPKNINVSYAGAREPFDHGSSGFALARNRRVDVTKYTPTLPEPPLPPLDIKGPKPTPPVPAKPSRSGLPTFSSVAISLPLSFPLPEIKNSEVVIESKFEGELKIKVDDKSGGWGITGVIENDKLSAKAEKEIRKGVMGKITFQPASSGGPATLKAGFENKNWPLEPEMGLQIKPNFVYINLKVLEPQPLPDIVLGDVHISMTLTGKIKCEIGPGPAMLARAGRVAVATSELLVAVGPLVGPTAAVGGALGVAVLIIGGTALAIQQAKEEGVQFSRLLAQRDGASSRLALEIIGNDAQVRFAERKLEWSKTQISMGNDFNIGVGGVEAMLRKPDARSAKSKAWKVRFASDGTKDFTLIRERVFHAVGGYNKEGAIGDVLATL